MKRYLWLLALPYVVTVSSQSTLGWYYKVGNAPCLGSLTYCEDLSAALNEAHERRTKVYPTKLEVFPNGYKNQKVFDNKSACGQDDCGKD